MNQTNPKCRDAFIEAMEADGGDYDLDYRGMSDDGPLWGDFRVVEAYRVWCLIWQPPRDVDPETLLGKLKEQAACDEQNGAELYIGVREVSLADLIDLIESQQRRIEELEVNQ